MCFREFTQRLFKLFNWIKFRKYLHCFFFTYVHTVNSECNIDSVIKIHQIICVSSWKRLRLLLCGDVDDVSALLGYYAKQSDNSVPKFPVTLTDLSILSPRVKKYRTSWSLEMGSISGAKLCPDTSVRSYHRTLLYIPEERRSFGFKFLTTLQFLETGKEGQNCARLVGGLIQETDVSCRWERMVPAFGVLSQ